MKRILALLLLLTHPAWAATVEFGWHPGSHGTADDWADETVVNVGWLNKGLVFFAKPGDVLDSICIYGSSADGNAEQSLMYVYTLTGDLGKPDDRVHVDTITGITNANGTFKCAAGFAFTARTWYCIAGDTLSPSAGGFYGPHRTTTGTAAVMVPQTAGEDVERQTAPAADPWGVEGINDVSFREMWGVVTLGTVSAGRNQVTYVSDWDSSSGTGTSTTWIMSKPASAANLDVMIAAFVKGDDLAGSSVTEPSGWNVLHESSATAGDDQQLCVYYHIVTDAAGEPSTYTWTLGAAETRAGGIVIFRNVDTTAIADVSPFSNYILQIRGNGPINRSVTTQTDSSMVFMVATASLTDTGTVTTPTGTTNLWARKAGNNTSAFNACFAAYDLKETAGATGDYTWTANDIDSSDCHGFIFALRPREASAAANAKITGPGIVWIVDGKPDKWWNE
jgi:hypothetical protein